LDQYYNGRKDRPYPLRAKQDGASAQEYHAAGLLIFRLMRPLAICHLVEQQTFAGDWLLDPDMVDVQRFNHAAFEMLTGSQLGKRFSEFDSALSDTTAVPVLLRLSRFLQKHLAPRRIISYIEGMPFAARRDDDSEEDDFDGFDDRSCWDPPNMPPQQGWPNRPYQRIRASYLRAAAEALIMPENVRRCMTHKEFLDRWGDPPRHTAFHEALEPVKQIIDKFSPADNPVFWLRLVGYAYVCKWFHDSVRRSASRRGARRFWHWRRIEYTPEEVKVVKMLQSARPRWKCGRVVVSAESRDGYHPQCAPQDTQTAAQRPAEPPRDNPRRYSYTDYPAEHADHYERKFLEIIGKAL